MIIPVSIITKEQIATTALTSNEVVPNEVASLPPLNAVMVRFMPSLKIESDLLCDREPSFAELLLSEALLFENIFIARALSNDDLELEDACALAPAVAMEAAESDSEGRDLLGREAL